VNLSDIAAMGGRPKYAVFSLGLPEKIQVESIEEFYQGAKKLGDKFQTAIVGGDTTQSPDRLFISVTVVGEVEEEKLTRRSGARVGDAVFVTGTLGGAQAGLQLLTSDTSPFPPRGAPPLSPPSRGELKGGVSSRADSMHGVLIDKHLSPQPRINEARFLVENFRIHAMIDVSDGLASEINHICKQSNVGAFLNADEIPIDSATQEAADFFKDKPLNYALRGGEDFELLFTAPEEIANELQKKFREKFGFECSKIGVIKEQADGIILEDTDGKQVPIPAEGYEHFGAE
jgi:thiamine-monophosphate kinase